MYWFADCLLVHLVPSTFGTASQQLPTPTLMLQTKDVQGKLSHQDAGMASHLIAHAADLPHDYRLVDSSLDSGQYGCNSLCMLQELCES